MYVSVPTTLFADGVSLRPCCLEPCVLSCFWGCEVSALQGVLQAHQHGLRLSTPQQFQDALHLRYHHYQSFQYPFQYYQETIIQLY